MEFLEVCTSTWCIQYLDWMCKPPVIQGDAGVH
jgi:hypothetical protein